MAEYYSSLFITILTLKYFTTYYDVKPKWRVLNNVKKITVGQGSKVKSRSDVYKNISLEI